MSTGRRSLVERLQGRDPSALRELFEQEGRRALGLALRVLGDEVAAEDAVQEAFAQLWERADRLATEGRIESLLMTMVYRRAIDLVRARRNQAELPHPDMLPLIDEGATLLLDRVVEELSTEGLRLRMHAALRALPAEQRTVVEQAYFGGLTLREIAERGGLPLGTVKSRMRLGMEKLGEVMRTRALR
jgi:RNA polymerase sigma-70 factor (ECF subfamily)